MHCISESITSFLILVLVSYFHYKLMMLWSSDIAIGFLDKKKLLWYKTITLGSYSVYLFIYQGEMLVYPDYL